MSDCAYVGRVPHVMTEGFMKRSILVALGIGTIISSAAAIGIGAAWNSAPRSMTRAQYDSTLADIETVRPLVLARCDALPGLEKELCRV